MVKHLKWTDEMKLRVATLAYKYKAYKRTNKSMKCKWSAVLLNIRQDPAFSQNQYSYAGLQRIFQRHLVETYREYLAAKRNETSTPKVLKKTERNYREIVLRIHDELKKSGVPHEGQKDEIKNMDSSRVDVENNLELFSLMEHFQRTDKSTTQSEYFNVCCEFFSKFGMQLIRGGDDSSIAIIKKEMIEYTCDARWRLLEKKERTECRVNLEEHLVSCLPKRYSRAEEEDKARTELRRKIASINPNLQFNLENKPLEREISALRNELSENMNLQAELKYGQNDDVLEQFRLNDTIHKSNTLSIKLLLEHMRQCELIEKYGMYDNDCVKDSMDRSCQLVLENLESQEKGCRLSPTIYEFNVKSIVLIVLYCVKTLSPV